MSVIARSSQVEAIIRHAHRTGKASAIDVRLYVYPGPGPNTPGAALSVLCCEGGGKPFRLGPRLVIPAHELIGATTQEMADAIREVMRNRRFDAAFLP